MEVALEPPTLLVSNCDDPRSGLLHLGEPAAHRRVSHLSIVKDDVTYGLVVDALANPGTANPDRAEVNCARDVFPGAGKPQFGPPPKGTDPHIVDREPPLEPYARG